MIDEYCERYGSGLFEESFNTLSNLVFIGTHFLWHVFNGALIYCAMRAIILKQASQSIVATSS